MKLRVKYTVTEAGRFLGHLDLTRTIMRVLRRAELPVMLTEGFNPHPKLSFAMPLSVGHTSKGEFFEVVLNERLTEKDFRESFNRCSPQAIAVTEVREVTGSQESMSSLINSARYRIVFPFSECEGLDRAFRSILQEKEIVILKKSKRKIKETDIRPLIYDLSITEEDHYCIAEVFIAHGSKENLKIQDLLNVISGYDIAIDETAIEREGLYVKKNGKVLDLMEVLTNVG